MDTQAHPAFEFLRSERIESLNINVEEYRHKATGAQHIHISAENPENVFLVALRTVPEDSTGVAHILEHTALCGSEKYPVRDPFFMMIRRSLNTFMNAFTSSDWTAYPFASQNRKDYYNLLHVYLDAVFFSRLDELDFAQEGHRIEFSEPGNAESPLVYKGVVFNEMKGAMSSVTSTLWHTLCKHLYPTTTYHHNSGGDPEHIPDLSYEQLKAFYQTHYHPSNAVFMTFGDIPASELQEKFETQALARFERLDKTIAVDNEQRYNNPVQITEQYAFNEPGGCDKKTHIVLGWLLGLATDLKASMEAQLLSSVLLDNSASPLQQVLETTELGTSPSPLCGLDDSQKEIFFICGIEGSEAEHAEAFQAQVIDVLKNVAENGVPYPQLEASLHQLELQQREIGGDSYPYGLQLILTALTSATHRGDPIALLNLEPVLAKLREAIKDPSYIKQLAKNLLLDNTHRVRLTLEPDTKLAAQRDAAEAERLAAIKAALSEEQKQQVIDQAEALAERQAQKDDASILPKVGLEDIPPTMAYVAPTNTQQQPSRITSYGAGTNGLVYQQIVMPLPKLSDESLALVPLYTNCLTELGVGEKDYLATQLWQSQVCGGIHGFASVRGKPGDAQAISGYLTLSAKGLTNHQSALCELMTETLGNVHFDELNRIRELVSQIRSRREMGVTGNGHSLAMSAAASGVSPGAKISHQWGGLGGIQSLKALDKALNEPGNLETLAEHMQQIHQQILAMQSQWLLVAENDRLAEFTQTITRYALQRADEPENRLTIAPVNERIQQLWETNTQVNFCARAYPTVPTGHPDAAALTVLGGFLRNGYLHRAIREQGGAYGGGAGQDNHIAAFRFYSYRDPRIEGTLDDFSRSLQWLQSESHDWQQVEESILGVVSSIDKPGSPAGEAKQTFHAELFGNTREVRELFRNQVLQVTLDDLRRVAATYLTEDNASTAVITNADNTALSESLGLTHIAL